MLRRLFILWTLLGLVGGITPLQAQETTLTIQVLHAETSKPIADVICQVWDSVHHRTGFAQTDRAGQVKLHLTEHDYSLSFALLGFAKQEVPLSQLRGVTPSIRLKPTTTHLREVYVKSPPITAEKDTLHYRIKAFAGKGDRYLEDVLKKLPGVQVHEDGRIEYQGRSINKFYIEGMDPLGMNYKQASRNLPTEAVDQVDVIQHNQHKRILQGKVFDEHPALNIRLHSRYRFRPFGEVTAGAGLPLLRAEGKTFLMQAGKGNQLVANIQANNTGKDLQSDFIEPIDFLQLETYIFSPSLFLSSALGTQRPPLSLRRYLQNKALGWSVNDLQRLSENATLRLQAKGYHDRQYRESHQQTDYFGAQPFQLQEQSTLKTQPDHYRLGLHYELNSPTSFLQADLAAGQENSRYLEELEAGGRGYGLSLSQRPRWVNAELQGNVHLGRHLLSLHSTGQLYTAPERLSGSDLRGQVLDEVREVTQLANRSKASINFSSRLFTLRTSFQTRIEERRFTQLPTSLSPTRYRILELGPELSLTLKLTQFSTTLSSPIRLRSEALHLGSAFEERTRLDLAPRLAIQRQFDSHTQLSVTGSYDQSPDSDPYYLLGTPARRSYRLYYSGISRLSERKTWSASSRLTYHDPVVIFFTHLDLSYSHSTYDHYRDLSHSTAQSWSIPIDSLHRQQSYSAQLTVHKSIAPIGLSIRSELGYSGQHYLTSLQRQAYPARNQTARVMALLGWTKLSWLDLSYQGELLCSQLTLPHHTPPAVWRLGEELKAVFALSKALQLTCRLEHTMNPAPAPQGYLHSFFCDAAALWKLRKRLSLSLRLTNLFDERAYSLTTLTGSQQVRYTLPLRGRELMLSCSFRL